MTSLTFIQIAPLSDSNSIYSQRQGSAKTKPRVTVVTVAYNSQSVLPLMMRSLPDDLELVVVDNGRMAEAEVEKLQTVRPFRYLACEQNIGFGAACNKGAQHSSREFIFFLNPDASLTEGCLDALLEKAKRLRWFGIDRSAKQGGIWSNDIVEVGYKYQMTDIGASIGLVGLKMIDSILKARNDLFKVYEAELKSPRVRLVGTSEGPHHFTCAWLLTIVVDKGRVELMQKLRENGIESGQVHYRNDRYSVLGGRRNDLPLMDAIEDNYLVLPLHPMVQASDVKRICALINEGW